MTKILLPTLAGLERLKKCCSHSETDIEEAVFLVFGFVSAQLQGLSSLLFRRSLAKNQKSSLRIGYSIFLAALMLLAGCAQNYVIVRTDFSRIYVSNKPKFTDGYYYYKDATGQQTRISAGRVREVAPASMVSDPNAAFKPVHTD